MLNESIDFYQEPLETKQFSYKSKEPEIINISLNFSDRYLPNRLWEMRISQIPFSQKAPLDCRQYYTGSEGVVQTFNFADNGRHLANQNYRICIRQESNMCSIVYQPCDDQSFAIGPLYPRRRNMTTTTAMPQSGATLGATISPTQSQQQQQIMQEGDQQQQMSQQQMMQQQQLTTTTTIQPTTIPIRTTIRTTRSPPRTTIRVTTQASLNDNVEGSGGGEPARIEPDFMALFRNTIFDFRSNKRRNSRRLYSTCNDRITMPCIIEDFIGPGKGPLPGCEPVHCGSSFCATAINPCRIETTVTPFYLGVKFGNGRRKGSPEENIGACIKYSQMECL